MHLVRTLVEQHNQLARSFEPRAGERVISQVTEHPLCWVVSVDSAEFVRTGDHSHRLMGGNLFLVDRVDGGFYQINSRAFAIEDWEPGYRRLARSEPSGAGRPRRLFRGRTDDTVQWISPVSGAHPS